MTLGPARHLSTRTASEEINGGRSIGTGAAPLRTLVFGLRSFQCPRGLGPAFGTNVEYVVQIPGHWGSLFGGHRLFTTRAHDDRQCVCRSGIHIAIPRRQRRLSADSCWRRGGFGTNDGYFVAHTGRPSRFEITFGGEGCHFRLSRKTALTKRRIFS